MAQTIMKWIYGYLDITLKGNSPERFLNLCRGRELSICNIRCEKNQYKFCMNIEDYRKLRPIVRKTKTMPLIKRKKGLPFVVQKMKRRKGFILGFLCFLGLIIFMSKLVWHIEVLGEYSHTQDELMKYMHTNGIHRLMLLSDVDCTAIEESIRKEYEDIGWVSAQIDGTKLFVRIKETNMPKLYVEETTPRHIVADRDGIIESIVTRTGTPLVKAGDEVKKGDILISGVVDIMGDNELLVRKSPVVADGDIMLATRYVYKNARSTKYIGKEYTGKQTKELRIRIRDNALNLYIPEFLRQNWEKEAVMIESKPTLFATFDVVTRKEYVEVEKTYEMEESTEYLKCKYIKYLKKITEKGVIIRKNNVKIKKIGNNLVASGNLEVLQPITTYKKISDSEWRIQESNEHSGNDN